MKRSCSVCQRIVPATQSRCDAHEREHKAQRQSQKDQYASDAWRVLRAQVVRRGHCEDCGDPGAVHVHHRFSVRSGNPLICPPDHLLLLCHPCHQRRECGYGEPSAPGLLKAHHELSRPTEQAIYVA